MSAYFAVAYDDRIELATDGAIYTDDGTIIRIEEKFWASDRLPLTFAGRGDSNAVASMGEVLKVLCTFNSVDDTIERLAAALKRNQRGGSKPVDGIVASVSETNGPQLHWFTTSDHFEGYEPFRLYDVGAEWAGGPTPDPETLAAYGFPERLADSTLAESAADLFEAMRKTKMVHLAHGDKPMLYAVGGHVDLTTVRSSGITVERLRTWPDVVGRKIEPFLGEFAEAA